MHPTVKPATMNRLIIVCICSLALSIRSFAQAPTASPIATTPPEVQRLAYYLGTWRGEGETKAGPFGPAGKLSSTTTCDWFAGGFISCVEARREGPRGSERS